MRPLVEFRLEDGARILIEASGESTEAVRGVGKFAEGVIRQAQKTFSAALGDLEGSAEMLVKKFRTMSCPPENISVEFGIKSDLSGNVFIAEVGAEATFKMTLTWRGAERM